MPQATRVEDINTGHDMCAPVPLIKGSPNVFINGRQAGRVGDPYAPHKCLIHPVHVGTIGPLIKTVGSSTVFINGQPAGRVGDAVSCGGSGAVGSPNVIIGG